MFLRKEHVFDFPHAFRRRCEHVDNYKIYFVGIGCFICSISPIFNVIFAVV
ncbi:MAG: hypothetical protein ACRCVG_04090 [Methanobacteriaceae archaeon]